jgi:tyrosyl-tRNA synthetase
MYFKIMKNKENLQKIYDILNRGTVEVLVKADLEKKLLSGKKLRIKLGIDPSGKDLHIGHMVVIRKLREFQELGHHILLLFGNFTGQIGDPTGKNQTRPIKNQEELEENAKHYLNQVKTMLDIKNIEVVWNADWLRKLNFADVVHLASNFTVSQMLERDMFQERIKISAPISVHEFMYPLMQGYDSVALKCDVELGGTDQTFNLLAGRTLQKAYGQVPQDIITVPILEGTDGKIKMGKTTNNYIGVSDSPKEMYGKVMSIPDELIIRYFELATDISLNDIAKYKKALSKGENPRNLKMTLAKAIVSIYHSKDLAQDAEQEFINIFSNKGLPDNIDQKGLAENSINVVELLTKTGLTLSKNEARRLIEGGGVKIDGVKIADISLIINLEKEKLVQAGKRKFLKVVSKKNKE